ncbi:phosphopantetheine-binding protein [Streptomyces zagrosensis]|uniref:Acyl carrier protein n=1 Tax=Streptomyces zagrosensis TaxID=1042984 RepID=A0A7W9QAG4_9ACTN|nr:phosphopantetheine-binding protein [Streptomyces zagrosensis]MBB5936384.1 acyl carrier protein [Streptomyces zagrosensis]
MPDTVVKARQQIRELLVDVFGGPSFVDGVHDAVSLREAGLPSTALVALLVAMEDAFGFEWDDDVPPEALRSIESLAGHVAALRD